MQMRKVPMRMCTGCCQMKPKRELVRVGKSQDGEISLDLTGKKAGRGAYVCPAVECLEKAQKIRALERALEHKVDPEVFERLKEEITKGE